MRGLWSPARLVADDRDSRWFALFMFVGYVALVSCVAWHHEPWRDEADPWLYVRDCDLWTIVARR